MEKKILLSFDLEEFDIPNEYGNKVDLETQFEISKQGLLSILELLDRFGIKATFFVTASFAEKNKDLIKKISDKHEIASHGYNHSDFKTEDLKRSKQKIESIIGKTINGFRMPKMQAVDDMEVQKAGYIYNSSLNPTYLPGRYNNFFKPRTYYKKEDLYIIPTSVTPYFRFPLFWLIFKNLPLWLVNAASKFTLKKDDYLSLYFHTWEFADISKFKLPNYIKSIHSQNLLNKLEKYIGELKKAGKFISYSDFIKYFCSRKKL